MNHSFSRLNRIQVPVQPSSSCLSRLSCWWLASYRRLDFQPQGLPQTVPRQKGVVAVMVECRRRTGQIRLRFLFQWRCKGLPPFLRFPQSLFIITPAVLSLQG